MIQTCQVFRSTKPKPNKSTPAKLAATETPVPLLPYILSRNIHIYEYPIRRMYTNDLGCFPIRARSSNQYIVIAFHCNTNTILNSPFKTRGDTHHIAAYNSTMQKLTSRGQKVNLQVLDN